MIKFINKGGTACKCPFVYGLFLKKKGVILKAIIFDIDNTLINWCDNFLKPLKDLLKEYGYKNQEIVLNINRSLDNHRYYYNKLTKENLFEYINKENNTNLDINFINKLIEYQKELYYKDENVNETLKYLSKKYDLYIMTDWFKETQTGRLKNMGILKYFKEIYGADNNYYKNNIKAYDVILNKYKCNECLFVGDNLELDVKIPNSLGINVIWKTNKESKEYKTIKEIKELMEML